MFAAVHKVIGAPTNTPPISNMTAFILGLFAAIVMIVRLLSFLFHHLDAATMCGPMEEEDPRIPNVMSDELRSAFINISRELKKITNKTVP